MDSCLEDRKGIEAELEQTLVKNNALVRNLNKLEAMVADLDTMKAASPKRASSINDKAPNSRHIKLVAELESKLKSAQDRLKKNTSQINSLKADNDSI